MALNLDIGRSTLSQPQPQDPKAFSLSPALRLRARKEKLPSPGRMPITSMFLAKCWKRAEGSRGGGKFSCEHNEEELQCSPNST